MPKVGERNPLQQVSHGRAGLAIAFCGKSPTRFAHQSSRGDTTRGCGMDQNFAGLHSGGTDDVRCRGDQSPPFRLVGSGTVAERTPWPITHPNDGRHYIETRAASAMSDPDASQITAQGSGLSLAAWSRYSPRACR